MNSKEREKRRTERRVFEMLAPLINWQVIPDSIEQPDPPHPDIECEVAMIGRRAVELTALDSAKTRQRLANWHSTRPAWAHALGTWAPEQRKQLNTDSDNLSLSLTIEEGANGRVRAKIMLQIQELMVDHPQFAGPLFRDGAKPEGLVSGHAYRNDRSGGVRIHSFSVGSWLPPDVSIIAQKLTSKIYKLDAPLELFVYAVHDEPNGAVGSLEQVDACVGQHLAASLFERVHLFHFGFGLHIKSYP